LNKPPQGEFGISRILPKKKKKTVPYTFVTFFKFKKFFMLGRGPKGTLSGFLGPASGSRLKGVPYHHPTLKVLLSLWKIREVRFNFNSWMQFFRNIF